MNESIKTGIFAGVAAVLALIAYAIQPKRESTGVAADQPLVQNYEDPGKAASLEIIRYSEDAGEISDFKVAKDKTTAPGRSRPIRTIPPTPKRKCATPGPCFSN